MAWCIGHERNFSTPAKILPVVAAVACFLPTKYIYGLLNRRPKKDSFFILTRFLYREGGDVRRALFIEPIRSVFVNNFKGIWNCVWTISLVGGLFRVEQAHNTQNYRRIGVNPLAPWRVHKKSQRCPIQSYRKNGFLNRPHTQDTQKLVLRNFY